MVSVFAEYTFSTPLIGISLSDLYQVSAYL